jgi:hypothetical protein
VHLGDEQERDFWILKTDANGDLANCEIGARDTEAQVKEGSEFLDDAETIIEESEATVEETEASIRETESGVGNLCDLSGNSLDLFENFDEHSDGLVEPGSSVRVVANIDSSVAEVTFRWYAPGGILVRETTMPASSPEDSHTPDEMGPWLIVADLGNGQVISETLDVSFFVLPESPVGALALVLASLGSLGAFAYFRVARRSAF